MIKYEQTNDVEAYIPSESLNGDVLLSVGGSHRIFSLGSNHHLIFGLGYLYMGIMESSSPLPSSGRIVSSTPVELPNHVLAMWGEYQGGETQGAHWVLEMKIGKTYISLGGHGTRIQLQQIATALVPLVSGSWCYLYAIRGISPTSPCTNWCMRIQWRLLSRFGVSGHFSNRCCDVKHPSDEVDTREEDKWI